MVAAENQPAIEEDARRAIAEGVRRGDPVAELEYLGLSVRTMNILENSTLQITTLEQLLARRPDELLEIPNVTPSVLNEVLRSLSRYDKLGERKRRIEIVVSPRMDFASI